MARVKYWNCNDILTFMYLYRFAGVVKVRQLCNFVYSSATLTVVKFLTMSMSMSSSMDPPSSGLPISQSYPERMNSNANYPDDGSKPAAMLVTSNPTSANMSSQGTVSLGGIPGPFRTPSQTRQYPPPNSLPACLPSSGKIKRESLFLNCWIRLLILNCLCLSFT